MSERIPLLKSSIEKLRAKLDAALFQDKSPESIRTTVSESDDGITSSNRLARSSHRKESQLAVRIPVYTVDCRTVGKKTMKHDKSSKFVSMDLIKSKIYDISKDDAEYGLSKGRKKRDIINRTTFKQVLVNDTRTEPFITEKAVLMVAKDNMPFEKSVSENRSGYKTIMQESSSNIDRCQTTKVQRKLGLNRSVVDSGCMECGSNCVCGQTAVAKACGPDFDICSKELQNMSLTNVSAAAEQKNSWDENSPHDLHVIEDHSSPSTFSAAQQQKSSSSRHQNISGTSFTEIPKNSPITLSAEKGNTIPKTQSHRSSPTIAPNAHNVCLEDLHTNVTPEKILEFEKMLWVNNLHPDCSDVGLNTLSVSSVHVKDLSLTVQSGSSGYMSCKHSEVSSLPDQNLSLDELSVISGKLTFRKGPPHNIADQFSHSDQKSMNTYEEYITVSSEILPRSNGQHQVTSGDRIYQPLKDMHLEDNEMEGDKATITVNLAGPQQAYLPLKDMSVIETEELIDDKNDFLNHSDLQKDHKFYVSPSAPCRKFSPLKDMSFTGDSDAEMVESKIYKYAETVTDGQNDEVITLVSVGSEDGKQGLNQRKSHEMEKNSHSRISNTVDSCTGEEVDLFARNPAVVAHRSGKTFTKPETCQSYDLHYDVNTSVKVNRRDRSRSSFKSDNFNMLHQGILVDDSSTLSLNEPCGRVSPSILVVRDMVRSGHTEEASGYRFCRSPKGSLKRVRFRFSTD